MAKIDDLNKYRPNVHFAPKENWMNDPNGLVFFKGEYHLFFQYNPNDTIWGPMHWGHAVSKDMITWEELDIALYPDELGTIFSGSAVVDWNNTTGFFPKEPGLVAIFTHHKDGVDGKPPLQTQSLAYSHDRGRTWIKYEGNPVLRHESKIDFRDPKVFWHQETEKWMMVLATGQTISFYSSKNLIVWQFESEFGGNINLRDGVWECPDLFKLKVEGIKEEKWTLFVSIVDEPESDTGSYMLYFIGDFDGTSFTSDHDDIKILDFGKDNYAGVSFSDIPKEDGRRIYLAWMSNWRYANQIPTEGWRSQMTIPRELSLREVGEEHIVIQNPVNELDSYFEKKREINEVISTEVKKFEINQSYFQADLNFKNVNATKFGITLNYMDDQSTKITFDIKDSTLTVDRSKSGEVGFSEMFVHDQKVEIENINEVQLQLIVDSSSIEFFVNKGQYSLTSLIFPDEVCKNISLFSLDGEIIVSNSFVLVPTD
jgi:levanase/fructan beta-fructosidase